MKHLDSDEQALNLIALAEAAGVPLSVGQSAALVGYLIRVLEMNRRVNLTRIVDPTAALRLHILDSLIAFPEVSQGERGPALDLGSGAGFPGVPLAVATGRSFILLDSVGKKADAVRQALRESGISGALVTVAAARAEEYAVHHRQEFTVVTARAVAPLAALVELASPLLCDGGLLVALKGRPESTEREAGSQSARQVGMVLESAREIALPAGEESRTIMTYRKVGKPLLELPRRTGLAQNNPLA